MATVATRPEKNSVRQQACQALMGFKPNDASLAGDALAGEPALALGSVFCAASGQCSDDLVRG
jgi:hypothetical protein